MAALSRPRVVVRAARVGEGVRIAALWRELWDAHEAWGGYAGSQDDRIYTQLAHRLDDDARIRAGHPVLGRHVHLVAELGGHVCGQVEGWLDMPGRDGPNIVVCDVRSLIVTDSARAHGAGRSLLASLGSVVRGLAPPFSTAPCVLAAEVLEPNPARAFYARVGCVPVSWSARVSAGAVPRGSGTFRARRAGPSDALAIAHLEGALAARRYAAGDPRFEPPGPIDGARVNALAAHLGSGPAQDPTTLVAVDAAGVVHGVASFAVHLLEPPFLPTRRALVGRFALDSACEALAVFAPLMNLGCRLAAAEGALQVEVTDLSSPGTDLYDAALATGAMPWSQIVTRAC